VRKRILSGLLVACIFVPTFFWAKGEIAEGVDVNKVCRAMSEAWDRFGAWLTDKSGDAYQDEISREDAKLAVDVADGDKDIADMRAAGETAQASAAKAALAQMVREREAVQDLRRAHLQNLNAKRLANEEFKLMKVRSEAAHKVWTSTRKVVERQADLARGQQQASEKKLAALVNAVLNAVEGGKAADVRALCSPALRPLVTDERLQKMHSGMPTTGFTLKPAVPGRAYEVLFDGSKKMLSLTYENGEWLVAEMW